jgi:hypothetical protein
MKKIYYKTLTILFAIGLFAVGVTSCKTSEDELQLPHLFRPVNLSADLYKTIATISWAKVDSAVSYTLQISTDSIGYTMPVVDTTVTSLSVVKELAGETKFFVRLRANASDTTKNSLFNKTLSFKTPAENIFLGYGTSINTGKLISTYMTDVKTLTIKWTPGANATHLILTNADASERDSVAISADEALAGQKVVTNLGNSKWTTKIYNKKVLRGTTYGTVEGDIVLAAGGDLLNALNTATSGQVILLTGNATFPIGGSAYNFSKNVKIRSTSPTNRSVVCMTAGTPTTTANMFGVVAGAAIDSLVFENIDFTGYCDNNPTSTKIAYLYSNKVASTVTNMKYTNCNIHNFGNTPMRISGAVNQTITNLNYNGCNINEIGYTSTYAIVNSNSADLINNINFSNCTISNFKGSLILRTGSSLNTINITNCTVNKAMQDSTSARYLLDLNTAAFTGTGSGITIKNCIFGKTGLNKIVGTSFGANGFRGTVTPTITGCYYTTDYVDDPVTVTPNAPSTSIKSKMTSYSGASTALWVDPLNGNFSLKDTGFAGKGVAGDLRW